MRRILIGGVRVYQRTLGHVLGGRCRFSPSCSHYAVEALERFGAAKGSVLAVKRVCRCHPWGGRGQDPVPPKTHDL